jgi:hypothetical protein
MCPTEPKDFGGLCRWVGGLGHELGHAFGLPHPAACDAGLSGCPGNAALMWTGYAVYPNTALLADDKAALNRHGAFVPITVGPAPICAR